MNTYEVDDATIATLTSLIPTDCWLLPDLGTFTPHFPLGGTDRGLSLRLRTAMGLPPGPRHRKSAPPVIIGCPRGRTDIIARASCRVHDGDRYLWRRYLPGTDHAEIERDAVALIKQVHRAKLDQGARVEQVVTANKDPLAPTAMTPPALPLRPASTSIGRMPDPELLRLYADAGDELGRRGILSPVPPPSASTVPGSMTAADAWDFLRARMLILDPELLRRIVADTTAERERRREALQAELARLG